MLWRCPRCEEINVEETTECRRCNLPFTPAFLIEHTSDCPELSDFPNSDDLSESGARAVFNRKTDRRRWLGSHEKPLELHYLYEFSGLKSKSLKRISDQRYAHFSIIGM